MTGSTARAAWLGALFLLSATVPAGAQTVDPNEPLPAGHPSVAADDPGDGDSGDSQGQALPAGHPGAPNAEAPQDRTSPAPDLRAGTIEVHLHDEKDRPIPAMPVRLGIMKQDVAEGDSRSERLGNTDARGVVVFDALSNGTAFTYRVSASKDAGDFATEPIRLGEMGGQRVLLHVFPVTRDIRQALVGMRGVLFVQPREDVFHIEVNFQILNIGAQAWVPSDVHVALPGGAKAFRASDSMSDTRFDRAGTGPVELLGTFSPGQREAGFQFQLDNEHVPRRTIRIGLPPHVAELRVVAEGARGMVLTADGFPAAEPMQGQDGSRLLVTGKRLSRGDAALDFVELTLDNLPVPSPGRWYAVIVACTLAALGLTSAFKRREGDKALPKSVSAAEMHEAQELVLDELVTLERLRRDERVGPRTYEETRGELLDALARLELERSTV
ncbi:MAG TPA: hypothetical protein VHU80_19290 [Polyangiaceae bacterium]|jgi:hypothetical protein|nr:hypothetical protein [Polyangiaceae bacterium]